MVFNELKICKFLHFQTCIFVIFSIIGILSRFKNIFHLNRRDILEHILSGFGLSAFFTIILFCIFVFPHAKYLKKNNQDPKSNLSFVQISLFGMFVSLMKAILWEFFNPNNTVNQFEYDLLGIFVYFIVIYYFYSKDKLYITPNKV